MNWIDVLTPVATGLLSFIGGAYVASRMRGKPPAPRDAWEAERRGSDHATGRDAPGRDGRKP